MTPRPDGRAPTAAAPSPSSATSPRWRPGRCWSRFGGTRVLCTASVDEDVPPLDARQRQGLGHRRVLDAAGLVARADRPRGRATASRRAAPRRSSGSSAGRCAPSCDMAALGERQVIVDCDVLQADGGTRTASICGGYLALHDALHPAGAGRARISAHPLARVCAAISRRHRRRGAAARPRRTSRTPRAEVDMNVVMTRRGGFVEVQGTAEGAAVQPRRARRPARPGRGRHRRDHRPAGRGARRRRRRRAREAVRDEARPAPRPTPTRSREIAAILGAASSWCPGPRRARRRGDGATLEENARLKARAVVRRHR